MALLLNKGSAWRSAKLVIILIFFLILIVLSEIKNRIKIKIKIKRSVLKREAQRKMKRAGRIMRARVQVIAVLQTHRTDERFPAQPAAG